jgi:hypothetical protein
MTTPRLFPQTALTPDETRTSDRLFDELLLELSGDTVVGLEAYRPGATVADTACEAASRRVSA